MKLTQEQLNKALEKVRSVWGSVSCEICRNEGWIISDTIYELREYHGGMIAAGATAPCIAIHCNKCGNVKLMNALVLGVIDSATGGLAGG